MVTAREINDRKAVGDNKFTFTIDSNNIELVPNPTEVSASGTSIDRELLQIIEDRAAHLMNAVFSESQNNLNALWVSFYDLDGVNVTGAYNKALNRIEL